MTLRAGYAAVDISPPVGTDLTGFIARKGPCEGVLDPLEARALVVEDGAGNRMALVTCDLVGLGRHLVARVRARAALASGVPEVAQLFNCSHTHAGPETGVLTTIGLPNPDYLRLLEERLADVVARAARDLVPVRLRFAAGEAPDGLAVNRVYRSRGRPEAYDHGLSVVRVETEGGTPFATLVAFACHAVALGSDERHASADYVGALRGTLEAQGTGPVLYVNGCGGDVNPASMDARGRDASEALGRGLAEAALPLWRDAAPLEGAGTERVGAAQEWVSLPYQTLRSVEEAGEILRAGRERLAGETVGSPRYRSTLITEVEYALRILRLRYGNEVVAEAGAEVQALRLGPLAVVGLPGEIFSSIGKAIKLASPLPAERTLIAGWTNDNVGYVPDHEAFTHGGGYEVDVASRYYGHAAPWAPEAGDRLRDAALGVLRRVMG